MAMSYALLFGYQAVCLTAVALTLIVAGRLLRVAVRTVRR